MEAPLSVPRFPWLTFDVGGPDFTAVAVAASGQDALRCVIEDALVNLATDDVAEVLGRALIDAHGAAFAEGMANKIGRMAHVAARDGR